MYDSRRTGIIEERVAAYSVIKGGVDPERVSGVDSVQEYHILESGLEPCRNSGIQKLPDDSTKS